MYTFLLVLFRVTGKRSLGQITTFDFVLLLIISEATQQALLGDDFSITNGLIVIITLMLIDQLAALLKQKSKWFERVTEGVPLILVADGRPIAEHLDRSQVDEGDILEAARSIHGLESMDDIKYAVLERSGKISVIPRERSSGF